MCPCVGTRTPQCVCGGQKTISTYVLSFHHVGSGDWTQTASLAGKLLYPQSQLDHPGRFEFLLVHFWDEQNAIFIYVQMKHILYEIEWIWGPFTKSSNFSSHRGICPLEHKRHFPVNQISEYQSTECKVSLLGFSTLELICYNYTSARRG